MKSVFFATALLATTSTVATASVSLDDQSACLESASARLRAAQAANVAQLQVDSEPCEAAGAHASADRCYLIAGRRFEAAERVATAQYQAEVSACLR